MDALSDTQLQNLLESLRLKLNNGIIFLFLS